MFSQLILSITTTAVMNVCMRKSSQTFVLVQCHIMNVGQIADWSEDSVGTATNCSMCSLDWNQFWGISVNDLH